MLLYFWKRSGEAGTLVVILGVVGELVADLWYEERKREQRTISGLSTLILILGLVIELYSNGRVSALSDEMIVGLESQVSHTLTAIGPAMERASDANATAESAKASVKGYDKQIADAGRDAAQARSDASSAELARAKLEKEISPRTLDDKHRKASSERLKPFAANFATRKITVLSYILDAEGIIFSLEIMDVLFRAGIKSEPIIGREIPAGIPNMGVRITGPVRDKVFIETLAKEINVAADTPVDAEWAARYVDVRVEVGLKPVFGLPVVDK
jgi:hypothetical protein